MAQSMSDSAVRFSSSPRFIDPQVLFSIRNLPLIAKSVVEGFFSGLHRSPYFGFSLDFAEYRAYTPGDDVRQFDWKVFARTDKSFVKKYEGDTNTRLYLLLDCSRSMAFSSQKVSKFDYGRYLAASLAYLARRQQDAVGLLMFNSGVVKYIPPRTRFGHYQTVLHELQDAETSQQTDIAAAMNRLGELTRRRSLVVLISDFYESPNRVADALRFFHHRGTDLILFHLLDPSEVEPPFTEISTLEDMETGEVLSFSPEAHSEYLEQLAAHREELKKLCTELYADYEVLDTSEPLDRALYRYLSIRGKRL